MALKDKNGSKTKKKSFSKKTTELKPRRRLNQVMSTFYQTPLYPFTEWNTITPPLYTVPITVPVLMNPFVPHVVPVPVPIITSLPDTSPISGYESGYSELNSPRTDDAEFKDLFPSPRQLNIDPNPIIEEFCLINDIHNHVPWILDLEFGIPKSPITRPIPIYNVKLNSISCKNTPEAIHPGFESCSESFKSVLLFYYDCIISGWYRGYVLMNSDKSVDNFQSWLSVPMQELGMCWL